MVGVAAVVLGCLVSTQPEPPPGETDESTVGSTTSTASTTITTVAPEPDPDTDADTEPAPAPETGLTLSPDSGPPGTTVVARQTIDGCGTYTLLWDGTPIDSVDVADGEAQVAFTVSAPTGDHDLTGTCGSGTVGSAQFTVTEDSDGEPDITEPGATDAPVVPVPETIVECEHEAGKADARLTYEPRRSMVVDRTYEVRAALSLEDLPPDVTFEGSTTVTVLSGVRCSVEAELTGPDFDVTPAEPIEQSFIGKRVLEWKWEVRPRRSGDDLELTLRIQADVVEGGRTVPGPSNLSEAVIDVEATPVPFLQRVVDWLADVFGHPIVPVLIVPIVGAMIALGRRRLATAGPGPETGAAAETEQGDVPPATPRHARQSRWGPFGRWWRRA